MIPRSLDAIGPAYLTHLLAARFPGAKVSSISVSGEIHGTATKALLELEGTGEFPRRIWLKSGWEPHSSVMAKVGIYAREPRVYAELLPDLGMTAPQCFGAQWDEDALEGIVLLEDLTESGAAIHSPLSRIEIDEAAAMTVMLGQMHGRTSNPAYGERRPWLRPLFHDSGDPGSYLSYVSRPDTLAQYLAMPRGEALPVKARDPSAIAAAFERTKEWGRNDPMRSVIHGDAHVGNSYRTAAGAPGLLDWQCVWWGGSMFDTAYYLVSALDVDTRRRAERDILHDYCDAVAASGGPQVGLDQAFASYCGYLAYGLTVWLTNSTTFQPEEFNALVASRFAQALIDHEVLH